MMMTMILMLTGRRWNAATPCGVLRSRVVPCRCSYILAGRGPPSPFSEQPRSCAYYLLCVSDLSLFKYPLIGSIRQSFPPSPKGVVTSLKISLRRSQTILVTMLFDALTVSFALHLLLGDFAQALPSSPRSPSDSSPSRSLHVPLLRRAVPQRNDTEFGLWAKQQKELLESKYGGSSITKRSSGTNLCV
jgi:hypothetical protein